MGVYVNIRTAFEQALYNLDNTFPTAWENAEFNELDQQAYQDVRLVFNAPENPTLPSGFRRERGSFVVFLNYPAGVGTSNIYNKAEEIANAFKRGTSLTSGGTVVRVLESPHVGDALLAIDRYILAIRVPFSADVFE